MKKLQDIQFHPGIKILVRCDLDVPINNGVVQEEFRLDSALPTLSYIIEQGGYPIICGHLGKPKGELVTALSTSPLLAYFQTHLKTTQFKLLENLRFDSGEEQNDPEYAQRLAAKAEIYVNESFATSHRKHASIVGVPQFLPSYAGLQLQKEIEILQALKNNPTRPLIALVGGAKLESKKPVIKKFLEFADAVLVGGKIGMEWDEEIPEHLHLPSDYIADKDLGPNTIKHFSQLLTTAKTIVWAGPMGAFEEEQYETATKTIANTIATSVQNNGTYCVAGGGDTINALNKFGLLDKMSFVSTGGSAMLQYIVEGNLPGIEVLK